MLHVRCCAMYLYINKHEISVETTKPCVYLIENFKYCNITLSMLLTYLILCELQIFQICKFKRKLQIQEHKCSFTLNGVNICYVYGCFCRPDLNVIFILVLVTFLGRANLNILKLND